MRIFFSQYSIVFIYDNSIFLPNSLHSIQQQLSVDQSAALKPDTKRPFKSRDDACKRLLRYHVFNAPTMSLSDLEKSILKYFSNSLHLTVN